MAEQNYERRFGKAPVKEDVGVFTADMVARVRKPEPCGQHEGPWDWTPVRLAPSMTVGHLQARSQDGPMKMDMRRVDCKLNRDLESRSLEDLEMVRGEFKLGRQAWHVRDHEDRIWPKYGRALVMRMRSFKANGVEHETH